MNARKAGLRAAVVLTIAGAVALVSVVGLLLMMWSYLFVSLMPRPWDTRTAPLPALHAAVEQGDLALVQTMLAAGDAVDTQAFGHGLWPDGTAALMIAASGDDAAMVEVLLDHGANIDARASHGGAAIHVAAPGALTVLIARGADVNARDRHGQTPLMAAAIGAFLGTRDLRAVQILLEAGADVNAEDHQGRTAVGILRTWPDPDPDVIRLLEEAGTR